MSVCMHKSHIEIVDGLSHVELVYGADHDGGSREEGEQKEKEGVEQHVAHEPAETPHWEILPGENKKDRSNRPVTHKKAAQSRQNITVWGTPHFYSTSSMNWLKMILHVGILLKLEHFTDDIVHRMRMSWVDPLYWYQGQIGHILMDQ